MKTGIISLILLFIITTTGFAEKWMTIESSQVSIKESYRLSNGSICVRLAHHAKIESGSNTYMIYKKSKRYLAKLYPVIKKDIYNNSNNFTYSAFSKSAYACDLVVNAKYNAVISFTSRRKTQINNYQIPALIDITIEPDTLAHVLNNERKVKKFNLIRYTGSRTFYFNKISYRTVHNNQKVIVTPYSVQGMVKTIPVKRYGCYWENAELSNYYGMTFDKNGNLLSGKLRAGKLYGFKKKAVYFFHPRTKTDSVAKLHKIKETNMLYYNIINNNHVIRKPIQWHNITLRSGDQFIITKPEKALPTNHRKISYKIILTKPLRANLFNSNRRFLVKNSILYYGNFMPASFTLADDAMISVNGNNILMKTGTRLHYYRNGQFKSGMFIGTYKYQYADYSLKLYSDISFHKNRKLKEGILAEDASVKIWGKKVTIPKDSVLRFTKKGKLETYTYVGDDNRIRIIFVPDIEK